MVGHGLTLALAESCTAGLLAARIADQPGCSAWFLGGVVAYHNDLKQQLLGVSQDLLQQHGAVSEPVARAMAVGVRQRCGADLGLSITGIAGPDGGTPEKPVGTVWIAAAYKNEIVTMKQEGDEGRKGNVEKAIQNALLLLCEKLK